MRVSFTLLHLEIGKAIGVLNYKTFQRVSMMGFFDLRYHGLVVKGCRLIQGKDDLWFFFFDQVFLKSRARSRTWMVE
jgi:hypothetical protein